MKVFHTISVLSLLSTFSAADHGGRPYSNSQGTVAVAFMEVIDEATESRKHCVRYSKGENNRDPYEKACFSLIMNERGYVTDCDVEYDDEKCDYCNICQVEVEGRQLLGYDLNCNRLQPAETSKACVVLSDSNIQKILVDEEFGGQDFVFDMPLNDTHVPAGNATMVRDETSRATSSIVSLGALFISTMASLCLL